MSPIQRLVVADRRKGPARPGPERWASRRPVAPFGEGHCVCPPDRPKDLARGTTKAAQPSLRQWRDDEGDSREYAPTDAFLARRCRREGPRSPAERTNAPDDECPVPGPSRNATELLGPPAPIPQADDALPARYFHCQNAGNQDTPVDDDIDLSRSPPHRQGLGAQCLFRGKSHAVRRR